MDQKQHQQKPYKPTKTYFYKKPNGDIFSVDDAKQAAMNHNYYEQIGVSDGTTYKEVLEEGRDELRKINEKIEKLEQKMEKLEDKQLDLELEEPENDKKKWRRKMKNLDKKVRKLNKRLDKLYDKRGDLSSDIQRKAFNAELEEARGNKETPNYKNVTVIGDKNADGKKMSEKEFNNQFR